MILAPELGIISEFYLIKISGMEMGDMAKQDEICRHL